jgi:hypothetical protein
MHVLVRYSRMTNPTNDSVHKQYFSISSENAQDALLHPPLPRCLVEDRVVDHRCRRPSPQSPQSRRRHVNRGWARCSSFCRIPRRYSSCQPWAGSRSTTTFLIE